MSIEPTCIYCRACDKFRCRSQEEAEDCTAYKRRQALLEDVQKRRREQGIKPEIRLVTVEEIDKAIDTLTRLKRQIGDPNA